MVLVSGGGTNLQALLDAEQDGKLGPGKIAAVVSDRREAFALERAKQQGIPVYVQEPDTSLPADERRMELSDRICDIAREKNISLIVLAGYLSILAGKILRYYTDRIINLHPSLLPKYGGMGMYGERVHRAVLNAGDKESGCTIHLVDEGTDTGPILLQRKVPVLQGDTPDALADRIQEQGHSAIVEAAALMVDRIQRDMKEQEKKLRQQAKAEKQEQEKIKQKKKEQREQLELNAIKQALSDN
jgi:phosphoribosylglycinamide formyltransferase-1